ncbi:MAG TPA: hypothetical protein VLY63_08920 [Anaerolineae bacterium]|nr:hypothetical protein [Anaerolineae bacterium]
MSETEVASETTREPCPALCGDSGSIQVEMHDTLGVIALAIVSLLLLRALLKEQAENRALAQWLLQQRQVD